jgi:hypothetical protein
MAKTKTVTATFTRINLIKSQIKIALIRTTDLSEETVEKSILKGIEKKWIKTVSIYALDTNNYCHAQLLLEIDWDEHNLQIKNGNATIAIADDGRTWKENTALEVREAISLFLDYVTEKSLEAICQTSYAPGVNREEANRELGMVSAEPVKWKGKTDGNIYDLPELKELKVGFFYVED